MLNCLSHPLQIVAECLPPCGDAVVVHGTCALPPGHPNFRLLRPADRTGKPTPAMAPKPEDPGQAVRSAFRKIHGCDPLDYPLPEASDEFEGIPPSTMPSFVIRDPGPQPWSEWLAGLSWRMQALGDQAGHAIEHAWPALGTAGKSLPMTRAMRTSYEPGKGGVVLLNFWMKGKYDGPLPRDYQRELQRAAGPGQIFLIDSGATNEGLYPYLRNIAMEANGVLLTSTMNEKKLPNMVRSRHVLEKYCAERGIPFRRTGLPVNFANVEYIPSLDLLIMASSRSHFIDAERRKELREAFGNPDHVIHVELDEQKTNKWGGQACYDLDLGFHVTRNANGEPVALIYPDCLRAHPELAEHGRVAALTTMQQLGLTLLEFDEDERDALAANSVSWGLSPGTIFLSSPVSKDLRCKLVDAGIKPISPTGGKVLGGLLPGGNVFGAHCVTLHLPEPRPKRQA